MFAIKDFEPSKHDRDKGCLFLPHGATWCSLFALTVIDDYYRQNLGMSKVVFLAKFGSYHSEYLWRIASEKREKAKILRSQNINVLGKSLPLDLTISQLSVEFREQCLNILVRPWETFKNLKRNPNTEIDKIFQNIHTRKLFPKEIFLLL